jgi:hypothetical protein
MFQSIPDVQAAIERIAKVLDTHKDGDEVTWVDLAKASGVPMSVKGPGRGYARRALRKLRRPYEPLRAVGIRLSAPGTAMSIVRGRVVRIDGAVQIADRTQRQLQERHLEQMNAEEQRKMLLAAGFFGAIRALASENRHRMFG